MTAARPRAWPVLLAAGVGLAILLSLGLWQVQRLAWKERLIAAIDQALAAEPVSLAEALARPDPDFTKVAVAGTFGEKSLRLLTAAPGGAGWMIVQGFTSTEGQSLLVARGVAGDAQEVPAVAGPVQLSGILRRHGARAAFDADNNPAANQWYWWDVPAMQAAALGRPPATALVLQLLPATPATEGLRVDPPKSDLRNNHLGYAITWFGLAAALLVVTGVFLKQRGKTPV